MNGFRSLFLFAGMFALLSVSARAQITPNASVTPAPVDYGQSVLLVQDGSCDAGVAWTENVIWQPHSGPDVVGNTSGFGAIPYTPHDGAGTYWYQFRLVDNNINFQDQWISFEVKGSITPNASVQPGSVQLGQSVTLVQAGACEAGVAWTENVVWRPDGSPVVLGNTSGLGSGMKTYLPDGGTGTYWYEFRLVDNNIDFKDQWISFTVTPSGSGPLPTSGYEIPYNPGSWNNNANVLLYSDCYNYALNIPADGSLAATKSLQPGQLAGISVNAVDASPGGISATIAACKADAQAVGRSFLEIGRYEPCPPGYYKVALVISAGLDYHWYRQNPDGTWSSKRQRDPVDSYDASFHTILDPQTCDRRYLDYFDGELTFVTDYDVFAGYFAVSAN